jgi:hypothetical protein
VQFISEGDQSSYVRSTLVDLEAQARTEKHAIADLEREAGEPIHLPSPAELERLARDLDARLSEDPLRAREILLGKGVYKQPLTGTNSSDRYLGGLAGPESPQRREPPADPACCAGSSGTSSGQRLPYRLPYRVLTSPNRVSWCDHSVSSRARLRLNYRWIRANLAPFRGGRGKNRTFNKRIKSPLLCQLSYTPEIFSFQFFCSSVRSR